MHFHFDDCLNMLPITGIIQYFLILWDCLITSQDTSAIVCWCCSSHLKQVLPYLVYRMHALESIYIVLWQKCHQGVILHYFWCRQSIVHAPALLLVHLKRFDSVNNKIHIHVDFPDILDLTAHVHQPQQADTEEQQHASLPQEDAQILQQQPKQPSQLLSQEQEQLAPERIKHQQKQQQRQHHFIPEFSVESTSVSNQQRQTDPKQARAFESAACDTASSNRDVDPGTAKMEEISSSVYTLQAVLVHKGHTMSSGHYVAYVRISTGWLFISDKTVRCATDSEVHGQNAYMIFYKRSSESDVHHQVREIRRFRGCRVDGSNCLSSLHLFGIGHVFRTIKYQQSGFIFCCSVFKSSWSFQLTRWFRHISIKSG